MSSKRFWQLLVGVIVLALVLPFVYRPSGMQKTGPGMPWQVELNSTGQPQVFGLTLGRSTVLDAINTFGEHPKIAVVASPGQDGVVEAYFDMVRIGILTGKLFVNVEASADSVRAMQGRATKEVPLATGAHRFDLVHSDWQAVQQQAIASLTFLPSLKLDEAMVLDRFGRPSERIRTEEPREHFLYPERGIDVSLDEKGKALIQYVLPSRFDALRQPLLAAPAAAQ